MKLIAIYANTNYAYETFQWTGQSVRAPQRRVEIQLTEEQKELLRPKTVSTTSKGEPIKEDMVTMFFEEVLGDE